MSIELLTAGAQKIEHSEKHDLESFFWVLLYICTMFEGPGQRRINDQRTDPQHPFGLWLGKMDNLEEVGENVTAFGIGSFRNAALGHSGGPKDLLEQFVDPHFKPLIPMLEALCNQVFLIIKNDKTPMRIPKVANGSYDGVLDILKNTLKELPAHGPLPPPLSGAVSRDTAIMPPPPGLLKIGQRRSKLTSWGSDSGYGGGETSRSGSLRGRRAVASTGDVDFIDGKKRRNNPSPNKTTAARRSTSSPTKHASHSSTKRSNDRRIIEGTSSTSSKRHKAGQV
jgi:Fungal protein kinase